jgi:hypothetical protein
MRWCALFIAAALASCSSTVSAPLSENKKASAESTADIVGELKKVLEVNVKGLNEKNVDTAMSALHSQSPNFVLTKQATGAVLKEYNIKSRLLSIQYIGSDAEYAVGRVKVETTQEKGPAFHNNVMDSIYAFRKESGAWKIWGSLTLETKYLD